MAAATVERMAYAVRKLRAVEAFLTRDPDVPAEAVFWEGSTRWVKAEAVWSARRRFHREFPLDVMITAVREAKDIHGRNRFLYQVDDSDVAWIAAAVPVSRFRQ